MLLLSPLPDSRAFITTGREFGLAYKIISIRVGYKKITTFTNFLNPLKEKGPKILIMSLFLKL